MVEAPASNGSVIQGIAIQSNGKIVATGVWDQTSGSNSILVRYNSNGSLIQLSETADWFLGIAERVD